MDAPGTPIPAVAPPAPRFGGLRLSLLAGAAYDGVAGLGVLLGLRRSADLLRVEFHDAYALRFCGLLLAGLALFHFVAALEARRTLRPAAAAIAIRFLGGGYVLGHTLADAAVPKVFLAFGCADLLFGLVHYGLLRRDARRGFLGALLRG